MKRSPMPRSFKPMRRTRIKPSRRTPDYDTAAWREGLGPCVVTGVTLNVDPHHCIYSQVLRRHGLHEYLADHRNRLALVRNVHLNHHSGSDPLPIDLLPDAVWEFAADVGLVWWLEKHYHAAVVA
jgi:hypothetical protein